jgi:hypothetical protein
MHVDLAIRDLEPGDRIYAYQGTHRGLDMFLCLMRARIPASEDVFALILLAVCPGLPLKEGGPFVTDTIYEVVGGVAENDDKWRCRASALVCFEGKEMPAVRSLALLRECMVNEGVGLSSTAAWEEVTGEGGVKIVL